MAREQRPPVLRLEDITKIFKARGTLFRSGGSDVVALNRINLSIQPGEIFALVGESGSGKTTAGRLIVGLDDPQAGKMFLDGEEITGLRGRALRDYRRKVQMIFQDPYQSLNPQLSIYQSVSEPLVIHRIGSSSQQADRVLNILKTVGLSPPEEYIHRYPHQLSGGQRQRVAIARAMVLEPEFVVADEPTSMLDASYSAQIFNILLKVRDTYNVTILFITHSLAAARYLCDRIAVIYKGHIMEVGPADNVIQSPRHPYTQALIDALPKFGDADSFKRYNTLKNGEPEPSGSVGCAFFPRCRKAHRIQCSRQQPESRTVSPDHQVFCFYADE
jgi:peptide/nickel transport system ATP-binding protein